MPRIDPAELLSAEEVAALLGWANRNRLNVYRHRHPGDFPEPVVAKAGCTLWLRSDVLAWARRTGRTLATP